MIRNTSRLSKLVVALPTIASVFTVGVAGATEEDGGPYLPYEEYYNELIETGREAVYLQRLIGDELVPIAMKFYNLTTVPLPFVGSPPLYKEGAPPPDRAIVGSQLFQWDRQFLIRRQFDLWAAVYKYRDSPEVLSDDKVVVIGDVVVGRIRESLRKAYSGDLYIQKEVERLRRIYAKNNSVVIAGLTGAEIIAYMDEHLPEPDPRALIKSGSGLNSPSNLTKPGNSEGAGAGTISGGDKSAGEESDWSGWLWFVCAVTFGGLAAAWYLRRRG